MIGTKLAHYEITSHLGSGGMGDVYQATDSKLARSVAIKFLPEPFSHDTERVARFQREARMLGRFGFPNDFPRRGRASPDGIKTNFGCRLDDLNPLIPLSWGTAWITYAERCSSHATFSNTTPPDHPGPNAERRWPCEACTPL